MTAGMFRRIRDAHSITLSVADQKRTLERQYSRPLSAPLRVPGTPVSAMTNAQHAAMELERLGLK